MTVNDREEKGEKSSLVGRRLFLVFPVKILVDGDGMERDVAAMERVGLARAAWRSGLPGVLSEVLSKAWMSYQHGVLEA
ncbi:hypothetical protein L1987_54559 [Smallanthus sonchifolius]|uniref:Uncharacterized protein n=1 Tax=Smallanthus sonchifolius TaxID=185202 RepID=A0ACB9E742_9ASTR|nr:hypothetical protein L1987_54559 [Smallanthus sonchifolius]